MAALKVVLQFLSRLVSGRGGTLTLLLVLFIALWYFGFLRWPWAGEPATVPAGVRTHDSVETAAKLAPQFTEPLKAKGVDQGFIGKILENKEETPPAAVHVTTVVHDTLFKDFGGLFSDRWLLYSVKTIDRRTMSVLAANKKLNSVAEYSFPLPTWMEARYFEIQTDKDSIRAYFSGPKLLQWNGLHAAGFASFVPTLAGGFDAWTDVLIRETVSVGVFVSTRDRYTVGIRIATR